VNSFVWYPNPKEPSENNFAILLRRKSPSLEEKHRMKRLSVLLPYLLAAMVGLALIIVGCEGEQGPPGTNPQSPPIITAVYAVPDSIGAGEYTTLIVNAYDPNGDPLTYAWSATVGTFTSPSAAVTNWTPPDSIALYVISVAVSDDDGTVNNTVMVGVNAYVPATVPSYLGTNAYVCAVCHDAKVTDWLTTPHSTAFADTVIPLEHRTTGYNPAIDNGGYDDNPGPWLQNVQCEACHGPLGPNLGVPHTYLSPTTFTGEACGQCHAEYPEYQYSGHGTAMERAGGHEEFNAEWNSSSCRACHISEAFIKAWDADWSTREVPHLANQVTCGTCHDPHVNSAGNPEQIRTLADFNLPYNGDPSAPGSYTVTGWGKGQLCGQCHHSRRNWTSILGYITNGAQRANPHESPQADMLSGRGSYEIPSFTYDRGSGGDFSSSPHTDACVSCHMEDVLTPYPHTNHNFHAQSLVACDACHSSLPGGAKSVVQTEIVALLDQLAQMLPNATQGEDGHWTVPSDTRDTLVWTLPKRQAGWAWQFVYLDGSKGVHNTAYAHTLLENAIDHLTPGPNAAGDRPRSTSWMR
jgi:hypothetical protein